MGRRDFDNTKKLNISVGHLGLRRERSALREKTTRQERCHRKATTVNQSGRLEL